MLGNLINPSGSYKSRITDCIIETSDKARYTFQFGDLEKEIEKKTSQHQFSGTDGTYVQDFGLGKVSFPITLYLSGRNYDIEANKFEKSASKAGVCILEHPTYGVKNIIIEKIKRQDNIKTSGNQAIFTLTITETILFELPLKQPDNGLGITDALRNLSASIADAFNNSFAGKSIQALQNAAARIEAAVNDIASAVEFISSTVDGLTSTIYSIQRYIDRNMSALLQAPFTLASSVDNLINAPSTAIASVKNKFQMYNEMYTGASEFEGGIDSVKNSNDKKNICAEKTLYSSSITGAICNSVLNSDADSIGLKTKAEASALALEIMNFYYQVQNFLDSMQENTENDSLENTFVVDSQLTYNLKNVVALTVNNLVNIAFSLKQERIIYTDKEYNIFELCYKLYGTSTEPTLQDFIDSNSLSGEEILIIPQNREIRYYV